MHCNIGIEQNTTGMTHLKVDLAILLMDAGRSLIQMRKSKGPSTDPCGTPRLVIFHEEDCLHYFIIIQGYTRLSNSFRDQNSL